MTMTMMIRVLLAKILLSDALKPKDLPTSVVGTRQVQLSCALSGWRPPALSVIRVSCREDRRRNYRNYLEYYRIFRFILPGKEENAGIMENRLSA